MNLTKTNSSLIQKWGGIALLMLAAAIIGSGLIYLTGNLRDALGVFAYSIADFLAGAVVAGSLVTAVIGLRDRVGESAPGRMNLALLAAVAAACGFVAVASIRAANRHTHLIHPELHLEESVEVLTVWGAQVAGALGAAWHFLGWAWLLIGSAGWTTKRIPRVLSGLVFIGRHQFAAGLSRP